MNNSFVQNPMMGGGNMMPNQMMGNNMMQNPIMGNNMMQNPMMGNNMMQNPMMGGNMMPNSNQIINNGPTGGTSILDLRSDISPKMLQQNQRQMQQVQQQAQHTQQQNQVYMENNSDTEGPNMELLVKDLNRDLDGFAPSRKETETDTGESDNSESEQESKSSKLSWFRKLMPDFLKEMLLLLCVYLLLSQGFIKKAIATHVSYIRPNDDGNVPFLGILIYGVILSVVYMIFKKIII